MRSTASIFDQLYTMSPDGQEINIKFDSSSLVQFFKKILSIANGERMDVYQAGDAYEREFAKLSNMDRLTLEKLLPLVADIFSALIVEFMDHSGGQVVAKYQRHLENKYPQTITNMQEIVAPEAEGSAALRKMNGVEQLETYYGEFALNALTRLVQASNFLVIQLHKLGFLEQEEFPKTILDIFKSRYLKISGSELATFRDLIFSSIAQAQFELTEKKFYQALIYYIKSHGRVLSQAANEEYYAHRGFEDVRLDDSPRRQRSQSDVGQQKSPKEKKWGGLRLRIRKRAATYSVTLPLDADIGVNVQPRIMSGSGDGVTQQAPEGHDLQEPVDDLQDGAALAVLNTEADDHLEKNSPGVMQDAVVKKAVGVGAGDALSEPQHSQLPDNARQGYRYAVNQLCNDFKQFNSIIRFGLAFLMVMMPFIPIAAIILKAVHNNALAKRSLEDVPLSRASSMFSSCFAGMEGVPEAAGLYAGEGMVYS